MNVPRKVYRRLHQGRHSITAEEARNANPWKEGWAKGIDTPISVYRRDPLLLRHLSRPSLLTLVLRCFDLIKQMENPRPVDNICHSD